MHPPLYESLVRDGMKDTYPQFGHGGRFLCLFQYYMSVGHCHLYHLEYPTDHDHTTNEE